MSAMLKLAGIAVLAVILAGAQLMLASMLPYALGARVYLASVAFADIVAPTYLMGGVCVMVFAARMLDVRYWTRPISCRVRELWFILTALTALACMFAFSQAFSAAVLLCVIIVVGALGALIIVGFKLLLRSPVSAGPRAYGRLQIMVGFLILGAHLYFLFSLGPTAGNCASTTHWGNALTREWAYYEVNCPFEVVVSPLQGDDIYYSCPFDGSCVVGNNTYTGLIASSAQPLPEFGFCRMRTANLLLAVARDLARDEGLTNSTPNLEQVYAASADNVTSSGESARFMFVDDDTIHVSPANATAAEWMQVRARYHGCSPAFLLWAGPTIMGLFALWIGAGTMIVILPGYEDVNNAGLKRKILGRGTAAFLVMVWIGASIGGADMKMAQLVITVASFGLIALFGGYLSIHGSSSFRDAMAGSKFAQQVMSMVTSDWGIALAMLCLSPIFVLHILSSVPCQLMRRANPLGCNVSVDDKARKSLFTRNVSENLARARELNWTSILTKVIVLGLLFMSLNVVVAKFTSVGMSALNAWIREQGFNMIQITLVFFAVGMTAFLNPLIPGPPIYVSGGILLVEGTRNLFAAAFDGNVEAGFWIAVAYTVGICTVLKLCAITVQQKLFGERMGRFVFIRRFIGVNTVGCRAIKIILEDRGLSARKVFILCGGPDWPTSVTTGILGLPLLSMLVGSLPIVFLIAPSVMAGASLLRTTEGSIWSSISVLAVGISVLVQSGSMLGAMHVIAKVATEREDELAAMAPDEEVLEYTKRSERKRAIMAYAKDWHRQGFPMTARVILIVGAVSTIASFDLAVGLGSACFGSFSVSDSIEEALGGDPFAIILWPLGYLCLLLLCVAVVCLCLVQIIFIRISRRAAKVLPETEALAKAAGSPGDSSPLE